jgi:hypothetical protein
MIEIFKTYAVNLGMAKMELWEEERVREVIKWEKEKNLYKLKFIPKEKYICKFCKKKTPVPKKYFKTKLICGRCFKQLKRGKLII